MWEYPKRIATSIPYLASLSSLSLGDQLAYTRLTPAISSCLLAFLATTPKPWPHWRQSWFLSILSFEGHQFLRPKGHTNDGNQTFKNLSCILIVTSFLFHKVGNHDRNVRTNAFENPLITCSPKSPQSGIDWRNKATGTMINNPTIGISRAFWDQHPTSMVSPYLACTAAVHESMTYWLWRSLIAATNWWRSNMSIVFNR